jgi:hypothetical protein
MGGDAITEMARQLVRNIRRIRLAHWHGGWCKKQTVRSRSSRPAIVYVLSLARAESVVSQRRREPHASQARASRCHRARLRSGSRTCSRRPASSASCRTSTCRFTAR